MEIRIVTDGACRGNPGPGGWAALIIRDGRVEEIGGYEAHTTNNRMELRAAIEGLRRVVPGLPVQVITDSTYLLNGITKWIRGWQLRDWQTKLGTPVENRDLWEELAELSGKHVQWKHVYGHRGDPENERANAIAQAYAAGRQPPEAAPYVATSPETQPVAPLPAQPEEGDRQPSETSSSVTQLPETRPGRSSSLLKRIAAARRSPITYLSLVNGELCRHKTWDACKERVHGVSNARFKKCKSAEEELATVEGWGVSGERLVF